MDSLKTDFKMTAEEGISLFAVHALQGQQHNERIPLEYMWVGNPYLTNVYFKVTPKPFIVFPFDCGSLASTPAPRYPPTPS